MRVLCLLIACGAALAAPAGYMSDVSIQDVPVGHHSSYVHAAARIARDAVNALDFSEVTARAGARALIATRKLAPTREWSTVPPQGVYVRYQDRFTKAAHEPFTRDYEYRVFCDGLCRRRQLVGASLMTEPAPCSFNAGRGAMIVNNVFLGGMASRDDGCSNWFVFLASPLSYCEDVTVLLAINPIGTWANGPLIGSLKSYGVELAERAASAASHLVLMDTFDGHYGKNAPHSPSGEPGLGGWKFPDDEVPPLDLDRLLEMAEQLWLHLVWIAGAAGVERFVRRMKLNIAAVCPTRAEAARERLKKVVDRYLPRRVAMSRYATIAWFKTMEARGEHF